MARSPAPDDEKVPPPDDKHDEQRAAPDRGSSKKLLLPPGQSTASYLEDLTAAMAMEWANEEPERSNLMQKHLHPDFVAGDQETHDCLLKFFARSDKERLEWAKHVNDQRDIEVYNVTAKVHRGTKRAEVFFLTRQKIVLGGVEVMRENVNVSHWQRRVEDNVWQMIR